MVSCKVLLMVAAAMAVVVGALLPPATAWPESHVVGDNSGSGWNLGVNYADWLLINDGIPAGDTLDFIYTQGAHNVVSVDENGYNTCVPPPNAVTWTSGYDQIQLPEPGMYFFICSVADHCAQGMKLAINVVASSDG